MLPFRWIQAESDAVVFQYFGVTFDRDFGPWKSGQEVCEIRIDFVDGVMYDLNNNKVIIKLEPR